jgi:hypothetical protein
MPEGMEVTMISQKQLEANRQNARKSTGPKTPEGKATVARNPIRHGLFAQLEVLPGLERQEDWENHRSQVMADLAPEGHMEIILAERVALLTWRLGRTARYEREIAAIALENAENDMSDEKGGLVSGYHGDWPVSAAQEQVESLQEALRVLENLHDLPPDRSLPEGCTMVEAAADVSGVDLTDPDTSPELPDCPDGAALDEVDWNVGQVRGAFKAISEYRGMDYKDLVDGVVSRTRTLLGSAEWEQERVLITLDQYKRARLLPADAEAQKIQRYEAHLERSLYRALHELQRMQGVRRGQPVPPPLVLDVDVSAQTRSN